MSIKLKKIRIKNAINTQDYSITSEFHEPLLCATMFCKQHSISHKLCKHGFDWLLNNI